MKIINQAPELSTARSEEAMERARRCLAGGDSSTMRVLPYHLPLVADRGQGSRLWDVDGNEYIDLNMAYGPLIFGHRPRAVVEAVARQLGKCGSQLGFPAEINARVAEKIKFLYPSIELLRFANSGTEANASAARLARAVTGRNTVLLFEGHYFGWSDAVFHRYHAPLSELPSEGFGPALAGTVGLNGAPRDALVVRWNDLDALNRCLAKHGDSVAACFMEPVMGNAGVIPPGPGFLAGARDAIHAHGGLLVFDEVITGMRVAAGGAQEYYGVEPDITVISKALGGGVPIAAFGASRRLMEPITTGSLFHGGVYSGNALVMSAADAVLDEIIATRHVMYSSLHALADALARGLRDIMRRHLVPHVVQHVGPMLSLFLTRRPVDNLTDYRQVRAECDFDKYISLQHRMQRTGVYFHPNQFEPMFLSTAHTPEDIDTVLERMEEAVACWVVR